MKSNSYESITFDVEKGLKSPEEYYSLSGIKDIFSSIFKRRKTTKDPRNGNKIYLNENESLKIIHYDLDTV